MSEIDFDSLSLVKPASQMFTPPVPYSTKPARKACIVVLEPDSESGSSVVEYKYIEDEMTKLIQLNYIEASLSTLVANGVEPHALDIADVNKLGVDVGAEAVARYLVEHADKYVVKSSESE